MIHAVHLGSYWYGVAAMALGGGIIGVRELVLWRRRKRRPTLGSLIQNNALNGFEKRQ